MASSEIELFEQWFRLADANHDGRVEGSEAVQFFKRSGLPQETLKQIWTLTAGDASFMMKQHFFAALRLVSLGQSMGGSFSLQQARAAIVGNSSPLPTPQLQGLTAESWQPGGQPSSEYGLGTSTTSQTPGSQWPPLAPIDRARMEQTFVRLDQDFDGLLRGAECAQAFGQLGVDRSVLRGIWTTVAGNSGYLNKEQFVKCVYLIENAQKGISPPIVLPPEPFPPMAASASALSTAGSIGPQGFLTLPPQAVYQPTAPPPYQARGLELSDTSMSMLGPTERGRLDAERDSAISLDKDLYEHEGKLASSKQKKDFYERSLQDIVLFKRRVENNLLEAQEQERKIAAEAQAAEKMYEEARVAAEASAQESGATFIRIKEAQERRSELEMKVHSLEKEVSEMEGANPDEVVKIEAETQALLEEVAALEAKKHAMSAQIESYKSQQGGLKKRKEDMQLVCAAAEAEVHSAAGDIEKIRKQVEDAKSSEDIDQIQKLLREAARVYSNLHAHALKAGIEIPKETRLMLYGRDLMFDDDMIGSTVELDDWNEDGFIVVDAFPDVKDELDKALFDAVMSSRKGTSKQAGTQGFEVNFGSTQGHGGTASFSQIVTPVQPTFETLNFVDVDDSSALKSSKLHTSPFPMTGLDADPFATPGQASVHAHAPSMAEDPFASFPAFKKPPPKSEAPKGFAVSFDDGNPAFSSASFVDFGVTDTGGLSTVNELNLDPFAKPDKTQGFQEATQGDNPFGESAFS